MTGVDPFQDCQPVLRWRARRAPAFALLAWLTLSGSAFAQAAIAGVVKDSTGAPVPEVLVEATSPALIEKTRTALTDTGGQYRIEGLRPGVYAVTVVRDGFRPYRREKVELTGSSTATVNVELSVGSLLEAVTV